VGVAKLLYLGKSRVSHTNNLMVFFCWILLILCLLNNNPKKEKGMGHKKN